MIIHFNNSLNQFVHTTLHYIPVRDIINEYTHFTSLHFTSQNSSNNNKYEEQIHVTDRVTDRVHVTDKVTDYNE